jgi:hypothetical protein
MQAARRWAFEMKSVSLIGLDGVCAGAATNVTSM